MVHGSLTTEVEKQRKIWQSSTTDEDSESEYHGEQRTGGSLWSSDYGELQSISLMKP
jgi:hypothetical protein